MLIYRDAPGMPVQGEAFHRELVSLADRLASSGRASYDSAVSFAIDAGMLESALADAINADERRQPITVALRTAAVEAARATLAARAGRIEDMRRAARRAQCALREWTRGLCPAELKLRVPEGFAYYGVFPEQYAEAALRAKQERQAAHVVCLGIRSIGTTLSAFAAAALEDDGCVVRSWTIRPAGHPFDRRAHLGPDVARWLLDPLPDLALAIDEGPGLSGSSFAAAVEALLGAGMPSGRIVLLPAWNPDPAAMISRRASDTWKKHAKVLVPFEEEWIEGGRLKRLVDGPVLTDLSAGAWRHAWITRSPLPAVQIQHERRKYLARRQEGPGAAWLVKFAGLGRFGERLAERGARLDGLPVVRETQVRDGFLARPTVEGTPLSFGDGSPEFLNVAADYIAGIAARFRLDSRADRQALAHMLETNAGELLPGSRLRRLQEILDEVHACPEAPAVALDGRMLPHEWLRTSNGYVKTDALEHHDDHFFPGPQDVAWDVAAVLEEFDVDDATAERFVERIAAPLGDESLRVRLPFHRAAYLAFRAAYCLMGADALGRCRDGERLQQSGERYRRRLAAWLA